MSETVLVCGAGAAGMMAAVAAARQGANVTLLEGNDRNGKKLAITGKGRCNVTNAGDLNQLIAGLPGNGPFLYGALSRFSNRDMMTFLEELGVPLKVERGNRVFPVSDRAADVVDAFNQEMRRLGVLVLQRKKCDAILAENGAVIGLKAGKEIFYGHKVIIATGGASYPATGSDGSGCRMARAVGHAIVPLKPSLVPLVSSETWLPELAGLSLRNVEVLLKAGQQILEKEFGELLFTHTGLSGPVILSLSRPACAYWEQYPDQSLTIEIDLKPGLSPQQLDARLVRDFSQYSRKQYQNALGDLLPRSLIPVVVLRSGIPPAQPVHQITKEQRTALARLLKQFTLVVTGPRPLKEAIVTAGGVSLKEINPKTMESKRISGLYFAGEVMDIDGFTGGFNLQAAFSSGYVAGCAAAESLW